MNIQRLWLHHGNSSLKQKTVSGHWRNDSLPLDFVYRVTCKVPLHYGRPALLPDSSKKHSNWYTHFFSFGATAPPWAMASSFTRLLDHTRHTTFGRTPLDEWPAHRRVFYLTIHNTHKRQTSMPPPHPGGIRTHNLSRQTAADLRLRPCGHWDRLLM